MKAPLPRGVGDDLARATAAPPSKRDLPPHTSSRSHIEGCGPLLPHTLHTAHLKGRVIRVLLEQGPQRLREAAVGAHKQLLVQHGQLHTRTEKGACEQELPPPMPRGARTLERRTTTTTPPQLALMHSRSISPHGSAASELE